ncbi:MAG: DUF1540 domain-containing protein [Bacillota bacterium]
MAQHIHCSVSNCHYWSNGNKCLANEILVTRDSIGANQPDNIDATQAATIPETPAQSCMDTCCKTFVSESDSRHIHVDGVTKSQSHFGGTQRGSTR